MTSPTSTQSEVLAPVEQLQGLSRPVALAAERGTPPIDSLAAISVTVFVFAAIGCACWALRWRSTCSGARVRKRSDDSVPKTLGLVHPCSEPIAPPVEAQPPLPSDYKLEIQCMAPQPQSSRCYPVVMDQFGQPVAEPDIDDCDDLFSTMFPSTPSLSSDEEEQLRCPALLPHELISSL